MLSACLKAFKSFKNN